VLFRLLGPVELRDGDRRVDLGPMKQRTVLAVLLADAGRTISPELLIDRVWGDGPPAQAKNALHTYLARLRSLLGRLGDEPPQLVKQPAGYRIDLGGAAVDLHRFRSLTVALEDPVEMAKRLVEALDLWGGEPLDGMDGAWAAESRELWRAEHRDTVVRWATLEIGQGRPAATIGPLEQLVERYPLVEPIVETLMRALNAAGRDPEALDRYEQLRRLLADQLGADPGPALQQLHQSILRGELGGPAVAVPAQIPVGVHGFVGRHAQLGRLDEPSEITVLHGTAGVGKTSLAVRWARSAVDRFPDGQLYVDLHGFSASGAVTSPAAALQGFLEALGVPASRIPLDLDGRAALYRSLLAGRRMLILLDNARDAEQVRPLLPGTPSARAVVTSRNHLNGLIVAYGARSIALDLLAEPEAVRLITERVGADRAAREPAALREMIRRCGGLPLALAVLASHIATRPETPLALLAEELSEETNTLDALASDDPAIDARNVFSWSLRALSPAGARLFRLLGLRFGNEISAPAAASLAALPTAKTRRLIQELRGAQLVAERQPGRYSMHDLLSEYAAELAEQRESATDRREAELRLFDHYLHVSHAARIRMTPAYEYLTLPDPAPGVQVLPIADYEAGQRWFATEYPVLTAAVRRALAAGLPSIAWRLNWAFGKFQQLRGSWQERVDGGHLVLDAVGHAGDRTGEAHTRHGLAVAFSRMGQAGLARGMAEEASRIHRETGDDNGEALALTTLAMMVQRTGEFALSRQHFERSVGLHRRLGTRLGEGQALNAMAWLACTVGDYQEAVAVGQQALEALADQDDPLSRAATWDTIGYAHHRLGRLAEAIDCLRRSIQDHTRSDDRYYLASVRLHLGEALLESGDADGARTEWQLAEQLLVELRHERVAEVRQRLADLDRSVEPAAEAANAL
jgi:DNA-binding SARP family transcriptional activator/Tfp pilus assembly protein PilF